MFEYSVLATGASRRQLHAISEEIDRALKKQMGDERLGIEGYDESRWILLDYGDIVVHVFDPHMRTYYALEDLWGSACACESQTKTPARNSTTVATVAVFGFRFRRLQIFSFCFIPASARGRERAAANVVSISATASTTVVFRSGYAGVPGRVTEG